MLLSEINDVFVEACNSSHG